MKTIRQLSLIAIMVLATISVASAAPIYVGPPSYGGECPSDAMGPFTPPNTATYTRQYSVDPSLRCVFESDKDTFNNLQGTDIEADYYLNSLAASAAGWGSFLDNGDDWNGIGQDDGTAANNIVGFGFTINATEDAGSFIISPLLGGYNQFAVAIKDGQLPFWSIFMLSVGQYTGDWAFLTEGGELSHFALYGRFVASSDDPGDPPVPAPEPASLMMLGTGLMVGAAKVRKRLQKSQA